MYILSQILIVISDLVFVLSMLSKTKAKVLIFLSLSTILFGIHYVCLEAYTGAILALVDFLLLIIFQRL